MHLEPAQKDALTELVNIGVGHAASTLNSLIGHKIRLTVPSIEIIDMDKIKAHPDTLGNGDIASVSMGFNGNFNGNASLMFPTDSAHTLVSILTDEAPDSPELQDLMGGTLAEVGNILLNGVMGSIGNMLAVTLDYDVPTYQKSSISQLIGHQHADAVFLARADFHVDALHIVGNILLFFEIESFHDLLASLEQAMTA